MRERVGTVDPSTFFEVVKHKKFEFVQRLTESRSLCVAKVGDEEIWFVYSRTAKSPVTVLDKDFPRVQAAALLRRQSVTGEAV